MTEHVIGTPEEFPPGRGREVVVDGLPVAVFNLDGEFYAVSGTCPHKGAPLALAGQEAWPGGSTDGGGVRGGVDPSGPSVSCPWHGLTFDLVTGSCPATRHRVRTFEVAVDDEVTITL